MDWDRINFGRVLRDLRTEAGLSQADLAERIGRDRRRLMAFEQGSAVREPRPGEIALLATGLAIPEAAERLRPAVGTHQAKVREFYDTVGEGIRANVAGEVSQLLTKLDEARELARGLSRSADKGFVDAHITPAQVFRSGRALAATWLQLHRLLISQAQEIVPALRMDAAALAKSSSGLRPRGSVSARAFREQQLCYWDRCDWERAKGQFEDECSLARSSTYWTNSNRRHSISKGSSLAPPSAPSAPWDMCFSSWRGSSPMSSRCEDLSPAS